MYINLGYHVIIIIFIILHESWVVAFAIIGLLLVNLRKCWLMVAASLLIFFVFGLFDVSLFSYSKSLSF